MLMVIIITFFLLHTSNLFSQDSLEFQAVYCSTEDKALQDEIYAEYIEAVKIDKALYRGKQFKVLRETHAKRRDAFLNLLKNGKLIYAGELHRHVQKIMDEVASTAPDQRNIRVFIVRDESANAFNMGGGSIFIHLGLLRRFTSDSELAFVLGHELGHDYLEHYHDKTIESAELTVNDSINKRIKEIRRMAYGRVSELNELLVPWLLSSKAKSRDCEYAADQFGMERLKNTSFDQTSFHNVFTILDDADKEMDSTLFDFGKLFFLDQIEDDFTRALKLNTQSSLGSFNVEKDTLEDLLRTHPFGSQRKQELADQLNLKIDETTKRPVDKEYKHFRSLAEHEVIAGLLHDGKMGRAVFHSLNLIRFNANDKFAQRILAFSFAYFAYAKTHRILGKTIDNNSHHNSENFNELLLFIRQLKPEQCLKISNTLIENYKGGDYVSYPARTAQSAYYKNNEDFLIQHERLSQGESNYYLENAFSSIVEASNLH
jgi:Zn-dependent protease with chaperone function